MRRGRKGGWYGWKSSSSSNLSIRVFRAHTPLEIRQAILYRAVRADSISINRTLPPILRCSRIRVQILSVFAVWALLRPWATALLRTTAPSCMTKRAVEPSVQKPNKNHLTLSLSLYIYTHIYIYIYICIHTIKHICMYMCIYIYIYIYIYIPMCMSHLTGTASWQGFGDGRALYCRRLPWF